MDEEKLIAKGPLFERIKQISGGLNIANEIKDQMFDYFEHRLLEEIKKISSWALEITELQGKRTLQERDWKYIIKKMKE